jgi:hypothetical protein
MAGDRSLPVYQLPTLLQLLGQEDALPITTLGKPIEREIQQEFFGQTDLTNDKVEVRDLNNRDADTGERSWLGLALEYETQTI